MKTEQKMNRDCPYCKEEIRIDAIKCKHCGSSIVPEKPSHEGICPYCKEQIHVEAIKCKHCNSMLLDSGGCNSLSEAVSLPTRSSMNAGVPINDPRSQYESLATTHMLMTYISRFGDIDLTFGGFGPTLPTCRWERQVYVCGSSLPGYPPMLCVRWVYCCTWPNGSKGCM